MEKSTFSIILSSVAIFFGLVALYTTRPYNWDLDFVGVLIAILSLLVTLLIGWHIYTLVDFREIEKRSNSLEEKLNTSIKRLLDAQETQFSNNIVTAIDMLLETSESTAEYDKRLSTHLAFYYVAKGNGSEAVRTALYRTISNEILIVLNMDDETPNSVIDRLSGETSERYVRIYLNDLIGHDDVRTWLNKLINRINNRT